MRPNIVPRPSANAAQKSVRRRSIAACAVAAATGVAFWGVCAVHAGTFAWHMDAIADRFAPGRFFAGEKWMMGPAVCALLSVALAALLPWALAMATDSRRRAKESLAVCVPASFAAMLVPGIFGGAAMVSGYGVRRPDWNVVHAYVSSLSGGSVVTLEILAWAAAAAHVAACLAAVVVCRTGDDGEDVRIRERTLSELAGGR